MHLVFWAAEIHLKKTKMHVFSEIWPQNLAGFVALLRRFAFLLIDELVFKETVAVMQHLHESR